MHPYMLVPLMLVIMATTLSLPVLVADGPAPDGTLDGPSDARPSFKFMVLLEKHEHMSADEFERYFFDEHMPYVLAIEGIRGYTVNVTVAGESPARYDSISEFWVDDAAAFEAMMASPETAATLADAQNFVRPGGMHLLIVDERRVVPLGH